MQLCERLSGRLHYLFPRVLSKIKYLNTLFELNEGASLMLSRILLLCLLSFLSSEALGFLFSFFLELLSPAYRNAF